MSTVPSYRRLAEAILDQAAAELNQLPQGQVRTDVMMAHAAKAQALAQVATVQALLEIGDVLRAATTQTKAV